MRLGGHVWFITTGCEIMAGCILQKLDQDGGAGQVNSGNGSWRASTKVK